MTLYEFELKGREKWQSQRSALKQVFSYMHGQSVWHTYYTQVLKTDAIHALLHTYIRVDFQDQLKSAVSFFRLLLKQVVITSLLCLNIFLTYWSSAQILLVN